MEEVNSEEIQLTPAQRMKLNKERKAQE